MIAALLLRLWPYLAIALLGGLLYWQIGETRAVAAERDAIAGVANKNAAIAESQKKRGDALQQIAISLSTEKDKIRKVSNARRQTIIDAPPSDDGELAPVLRRTLDGMRPQEGARVGTPIVPVR